MQTSHDMSRSSRRLAKFAGVIAISIAALVSLSINARVSAQPAPTSLLVPGNAAVTGFSGATPPAQIEAGVDPADRTFIDLNGPSLRVLDLQRMDGPPRAQFVNSPKPFTITAAQIGQVFAVALDNSVPPNIYAAATSVYGLPVVRPDASRQMIHVSSGLPNTAFMPGLWGEAAPNGGPGSIWKIDGVTGAVSLFANVATNGAPNSGPSLGGLVFDSDTNSLFAADRETGLIHRFNIAGVETGIYDHGLQGRIAAGLLPIAFNPSKRLDIASPQFDSTQPATWNYAPPERRVFGLGIRARRLYYAVADGLQIWSIAIARDGFADPVLEINVPPAKAPTEISKITFDDQGRMLLAERPDPTGAYDFHQLSQEGTGRVLRYAIVDANPGLPRAWQFIPDEFTVGMPRDFRNGNGGVAIGFDYDRTGKIDRGSCGGFVWSTGEQLRKSPDRALAARLDASGPPKVDGLQGNYSWLIRPHNAPPLKSYFIDYDDRFDDDAARGHMGDIAIWRVCGPVLRGGWMLPSWYTWREGSGSAPPPSNLSCPADQQKPGFQCCPTGTAPGANGACKPWCPNGKMDPVSQNICVLGFDSATYDPNNPGKLKCIGGSPPNAAKGNLGCVDKSPVLNPAVCQTGWSKQNVPNVGTVCAPTKEQLQCGPNQQISSIDNKCHTLCIAGTAWPSKQCCAQGATLTPAGQCCPAGSTVDPKTGKCSKTHTVCPIGSKPDPKTGVCTPPGKTCPSGTTPDPQTGACGKLIITCLAGFMPDPATGECKKQPPTKCPPAQQNSNGSCCPSGQSAGPNGACKLDVCPAPGKQVGGKCCSPDDLKLGGACATSLCGNGRAPAGASNACCDGSKVYTDKNGAQACCVTPTVNGQCQSQTGTPVLPSCAPGSTDPNCCASGYKWVGNSCCLASQVTSTGQCCPAGQTPSGTDKSQCKPSLNTGIPPFNDGGGTSINITPQCCASGLIPTASGVCCAPSQVTSAGICCPAGQQPDPKNRRTCVPIQSCGVRQTLVNGNCCPNPQIYNDAAGNPQCCPQMVDQNGRCAPSSPPNLQASCFPGYTRMPNGSCCANNLIGRDGVTCGSPGQLKEFVPPQGIGPRPKLGPLPRLGPQPKLGPRPQQLRPAAPPPRFRALPARHCVVVRRQTICR